MAVMEKTDDTWATEAVRKLLVRALLCIAEQFRSLATWESRR